MDLLALTAWLALAAWTLLASWWWRGMRRLERLAHPRRRPERRAWPLVSVVVAARDEAATIAAGLESLLAQDYPALELVVVDDRSRDGTGAAIERAFGAAAARPSAPDVRHVRIDALPEGWLGKTHAQARGAALARGEWLVFADADVRLAPDALRAALQRTLESGADHLGLLPRFDAPGGARRHLVLAFETAFGLLLTLLLRPWLAGDERSGTTLGIGAFGLYRREAYLRAGGHDAVRLRADDDLALARAVKAAGGRSEVVFAPDLARVTWYPGLRAAIRGLEKNAFAGLGYAPSLVALVSVGLLTSHVLPYLALLVGSPLARLGGAGVAMVVLAVYAWYGQRTATPAWYGLLHPVSVSALVLALLRSTLVTLWRGGIEWRGTPYPLTALRAAQRAEPRAAPHGAADEAAGRGRSAATPGTGRARR